MQKNTLQKIMIDSLTPVFKELGFHYIGDAVNHFRRSIDDDIAEVYFNVFSDGRVYFSKVILSVKIVEDIILAVGIPTMDLTSYQAGKDYLSTISDNREYPTDIADAYPIEDAEQLLLFVSGITQYMKDHGSPFAEHYHHLPNALKAIDALEREGQQWHQLLGGGADHLIRGLIISRVCSDPDYNRKTKRVDAIFYDKNMGLEQWIPYYEKLKEKLLNVVPKYNYEV
jgi:hypothetical protein